MSEAVLPFSIKAIGERLPEGGLALGALHEVAGGGNGAIDGAAAALFAAGIAARTRGQVLWCVTRQDLFAPALALAGLAPDRVIYVEAGDDKAVLACFEEALHHRKLGAVVAEVSCLPVTVSRRLQLAAEGLGVIGLALRRWRRQAQAADFGQPTASTTRWRISVLPSTPLPVPGVGRARRRLELLRCRRGESAEFEVEACDARGVSVYPRNSAISVPELEQISPETTNGPILASHTQSDDPRCAGANDFSILQSWCTTWVLQIAETRTSSASQAALSPLTSSARRFELPGGPGGPAWPASPFAPTGPGGPAGPASPRIPIGPVGQ